MDGPTPIIWSVNKFSVALGNINLNAVEQLTINIESNGVNHQLVLIKPWPPSNRLNHTKWNRTKGLSAEDIESVKIFQDSDNPRIEITMANENEDGITIPCDSIELL